MIGIRLILIFIFSIKILLIWIRVWVRVRRVLLKGIFRWKLLGVVLMCLGGIGWLIIGLVGIIWGCSSFFRWGVFSRLWMCRGIRGGSGSCVVRWGRLCMRKKRKMFKGICFRIIIFWWNRGWKSWFWGRNRMGLFMGGGWVGGFMSFRKIKIILFRFLLGLFIFMWREMEVEMMEKWEISRMLDSFLGWIKGFGMLNWLETSIFRIWKVVMYCRR